MQAYVVKPSSVFVINGLWFCGEAYVLTAAAASPGAAVESAPSVLVLGVRVQTVADMWQQPLSPCSAL
jgi:hypothetical protein